MCSAVLCFSCASVRTTSDGYDVVFTCACVYTYTHHHLAPLGFHFGIVATTFSPYRGYRPFLVPHL